MSWMRFLLDLARELSTREGRRSLRRSSDLPVAILAGDGARVAALYAESRQAFERCPADLGVAIHHVHAMRLVAPWAEITGDEEALRALYREARQILDAGRVPLSHELVVHEVRRACGAALGRRKDARFLTLCKAIRRAVREDDRASLAARLDEADGLVRGYQTRARKPDRDARTLKRLLATVVAGAADPAAVVRAGEILEQLAAAGSSGQP